MANAVSGLGIGNFMVDLNQPNAKELFEGNAYDVLTVDNDMTENEDYFQDDTLELGYEDEADRQVKEAMEGKELTNKDDIDKVFGEIFESLSDQDYFCVCEYDVVELEAGKFLVTYAYGGNY
tara:strand:+ start:6486 stop:6851 length:366 start_codon:yes stop_codon:yes gene_type:complete